MSIRHDYTDLLFKGLTDALKGAKDLYLATDGIVVSASGPSLGSSSGVFDLYRITSAGVVTLIGTVPLSHYELVNLEWGPDGKIYTQNDGRMFVVGN